jgi:dTDP-glucose 4,6-dehydratase
MHEVRAPFLPSANIMVTGGAGFIGSCFIRYVLEQTNFSGRIINYDKLTYAGNLLNLEDINRKFGATRYVFEHGDICDAARVTDVLEKQEITVIVHFAAESHVDRSILGPKDFIETNVNGTFTLLEAAKQLWKDRTDTRFHHISTDEVFGSLGDTGFFFETTPYDPRSPYSASKAASDHIVRAYFHTYGIPVTISNCSNNYGPYQFPEKLIPLMILNAVEGKSLPVYGDGKNVRDWLYVDDHCESIWLILLKGRVGETYNVGGECEKKNLDIVEQVCEILETAHPTKDNAILRQNSPGVRKYCDLIQFVKDRPGHDRRYAINCDKIKTELGWKQKHDFTSGLQNTISWFLKNNAWVNSIRSKEYLNWMEKNYAR